MKTSAISRLRRMLMANEPVYGLWITLESPSIVEMAVALGLDWIVIDAEHGHLDWKEITEHLRAAVRSQTVALVRVADLRSDLIKRALDVGADGILVPWIQSAEEARRAVAFARYPPEGVRGMGAERATGWGRALAEHVAEANEHVLVVPIIETVDAGRNIAEISRVPGVDILFLGPADYSSTAGHRGQWEGPGVAAELLAIKDAIRAAGKHCGIVAAGQEDLVRRRDQGFTVIGLGLDSGFLLRGLETALAAVGREGRIRPSLDSAP
jgi:2-keto-3-deoxy-L-rhamnonate aldolase RhmA